MLLSGQIRAARGFLKISQTDLATLTGLSINTIQRLEIDDIFLEKASGRTLKKIRIVFEDRGIEFLYPKEKNGIIGTGVRYFPIDEKNKKE